MKCMWTINPREALNKPVRAEPFGFAQDRRVDAQAASALGPSALPRRGFDRRSPNGGVRNRRPLGARQWGFSVAAAIFIVVILAALGAFMVSVGTGQQLGHAQDITGSRVVQAARAGVEWGVFQVVNTAGTFRSNCRAAAGTSATLPALTNMAGITVRVDCTSAVYAEGATPQLYSYQIVATACNNATCPNTSTSLPNLYVERRVATLVTN